MVNMLEAVPDLVRWIYGNKDDDIYKYTKLYYKLLVFPAT